MVSPSIVLAPGQRYADSGGPEWRLDRQLTILRVRADPDGVLRVAYRGPEGDRLVEPAAQFAADVAAGPLCPIAGAGWVGRC
jgi:hypothetical protein